MYIDSRCFQIGSITITWYGVIVSLGMLMGILLATKTLVKRGYKKDLVIDLALVLIPSALIGARAYYCIFYGSNLSSFWDFFKIWEGGIAIYGGVIGGAIALIIFCKIKKLNFLTICDCIVPCLILGQAIGRWGNFTNQEAYGLLITDPSWQWFPFGVKISSYHYTPEAIVALQTSFGTIPSSAWFLATFFYESLWNFFVLAVLLVIFNKINIKGLTLCSYFILYGVGRFFIEGLRLDSLYWGSFRVSQVLSVVLIMAFTGLACFLIIRHKKNLQSENTHLNVQN